MRKATAAAVGWDQTSCNMWTPLERFIGKLGIEFANFLPIRDEVRVRRSGVFRPDINGSLERFGTEQLFDESRAIC
jgi:hypothetical protein